ALARTMMVEGQGVAGNIGVRLPLDVDARIGGAAEPGAHKPSARIALERGRAMEIDAPLGGVVGVAGLWSGRACDFPCALGPRRAARAGDGVVRGGGGGGQPLRGPAVFARFRGHRLQLGPDNSEGSADI